MRPVQYVIVILLGATICFSAYYFGQRIFFPFRNIPNVKAPPYVHPLVKQMKKARKLRAEGNLAAAQKLLREELRLYPNAHETQAARDLLGEINTEMFFSTDNLFGKTEYVVKRGDSLWHIARALDSTPDAIMRLNDLKSDRIQPGEKLFIPDSDFTLVIDLTNQRVVVLDDDHFFRQYPIVDINLPQSKQSRITTKVLASTFWKHGQTVAPEKGDTEKKEPKIQLKYPGYVLYGVTKDATVVDSAVEITQQTDEKDAAPDPASQGIALFQDDLDELRLLIRRGTPVTIIRDSRS